MKPVGLVRGIAVAAVAAMTLGLSSCNGFFVCEKASCPASGSGGTTNSYDYVYATNSSSGSTYISGYSIASGTLTAVTGSPFALSYTPTAMAIALSNNFLYVAAPAFGAATTGAIYIYSVNTSTGALTALTGTGAVVSPINNITSMTVSADGGWLFVIDSDALSNVTELSEFQINTSTGLLGGQTILTLPAGASQTGAICNVATPCAVTAAPSGDFIVATLGDLGDAIFPFTPAGGIPAGSGYQPITSGTAGDFAATIDSNNYLYLSRTGEEAVYSVSSTGIPATTGTTGTTAAGLARGVALNNAQTYTYDANASTGLIYAFGIGSGAVLTPLISGVGYSAPASVQAIAADSSGNYLVALGYSSSNGLQLYNIAGGGALSTAGTAQATGTTTTVPALLVVTN